MLSENEGANLSPACGNGYWRDFDRLLAAVLDGRPWLSCAQALGRCQMYDLKQPRTCMVTEDAKQFWRRVQEQQRAHLGQDGGHVAIQGALTHVKRLAAAAGIRIASWQRKGNPAQQLHQQRPQTPHVSCARSAARLQRPCTVVWFERHDSSAFQIQSGAVNHVVSVRLRRDDFCERSSEITVEHQWNDHQHSRNIGRRFREDNQHNHHVGCSLAVRGR